MMDKKLKAKWLKALRSGKYRQGWEYLCREVDGKKRYCCLGVLAEVAGLEFVKVDELFGDELFGLRGKGTYEIGTGKFPHEMRERLGFTETQMDEAIVRNDGPGDVKGDGCPVKRPQSFEQIAAWIERTF